MIDVMLEQPATSCMGHHPALACFIEVSKSHRIHTWPDSFGAEAPKSTTTMPGQVSLSLKMRKPDYN
eukprot:11623996-Karenia_brevis.AAC.1